MAEGAGRGGPGRERERREPEAPSGPGLADYAMMIGAGAALVGATYGVYKGIGALRGEAAKKEEDYRQQISNCHHTTRGGMPSSGPSSGWFSGWFNRVEIQEALRSFWRNVDETTKAERSAIEEKVGFQPESSVRFRHKYNKFDRWFENLLRSVLKIDNSERKEFVEAFNEIIEALLEKMGENNPLFRYLYRTIAPAGSSWEDLRICKPDEFDVNVILLPTDIQNDVKVEDIGSGHISIKLDKGFDVDERKISRKFVNDSKFSSNLDSIRAQLKNWVEDSYIRRDKVMEWMQGAVDSALFLLQSKEWTYIKSISRSYSGPAITINATMRNGKKFSIDLVPAFEFSQEHLPRKTKEKVQDKVKRGISRTWYAIPKGPTSGSPKIMWRTSLYQAERDFMSGHYHLKPSIRIMKRLRDQQEWKSLSSYYLKTKFMWMMDEEQLNCRMGLGQIVVLALKSLEEALTKAEINYYWDDELNLLNNGCNKEFFKNVSGYLKNIIKEFEKSANDEMANPMRFFGCDTDGNMLGPSTDRLLPEGLTTYGYRDTRPSSSNDADCVVM